MNFQQYKDLSPRTTVPNYNPKSVGEEKEMATHSSILAWKSPWTEEPGGLQSMGLHDWACVHEGEGRWVGSNKVVGLKKKIKECGGVVGGISGDFFLYLGLPWTVALVQNHMTVV